MVKVKINPEFFDDYDEVTKQSKRANSVFLLFGPSSVSFEKALVPWNGGKYAKRNQRVLREKTGSYSAVTPIWATVEGMWFSDEEFPLIVRSELYPDLLNAVATNKVIVEDSSKHIYTYEELDEILHGEEPGPSPEVPIANNTLRFKFGDSSYDPNVAGIAQSGTWAKRNEFEDNVWDWTRIGSDWSRSFDDNFVDPNNEVSIIGCGDLSAITNMSYMFNWCSSLVNIASLDTSHATDVSEIFAGVGCTQLPNLDFSSVTCADGALSRCENLITAPNITFPTGHVFTANALLSKCFSLVSIPIYNFTYCTSMDEFALYCSYLVNVPALNTSNVTSMREAFKNTAITSIPALDYSSVTDTYCMFSDCVSLTAITTINAPNITYAQNMFDGCTNVSSGALDMYNYLLDKATTSQAHENVFLNCGINTDTGFTELEQIPTSWGGLYQSEVVIGGKTYHTVIIGNQIWLKENLDLTWDGLSVGESGWGRSPKANYYDNSGETYGINGPYKCGLFYNWYAVNYINKNRATLCPGWHVPSQAEYNTLFNEIGGLEVAARKLKATNDSMVSGFPASGWNGTDDYGFSLLPAGRYDSSFKYFNQYADLWSIDSLNADNAMFFYAGLNDDAIHWSANGLAKWYQQPIRLIKD